MTSRFKIVSEILSEIKKKTGSICRFSILNLAKMSSFVEICSKLKEIQQFKTCDFYKELYGRRAVVARLSYISLKKRGFQTWHPRPSYPLRGKTSDRRLLDPWLTSTPLDSSLLRRARLFYMYSRQTSAPDFSISCFLSFPFPFPAPPSYSSPPFQVFSPFRFLVPSFFFPFPHPIVLLETWTKMAACFK